MNQVLCSFKSMRNSKSSSSSTRQFNRLVFEQVILSIIDFRFLLFCGILQLSYSFKHSSRLGIAFLYFIRVSFSSSFSNSSSCDTSSLSSVSIRQNVAEVIVIYENGVREKIWTFNPTRYIFDYRDFVEKTKIEAVFYCDRKSAE